MLSLMPLRSLFLLLVAGSALVYGAFIILRAPVDRQETSSLPSPITSDTMNIQPIAEKVTVTMTTNKGVIQLELDGTRAPFTVGNFVSLAQQGFYTSTTFHRVIPGFMIQGGDPLSKDPAQRARHGTGGPGYTFPDEINNARIVRGTIAMANAGPDTNGSQFFIVTAPATPHLDGRHTNFGQVTSGMDVIDAIVAVARDANDNPIEPVVIQGITVETPAGT